MNELASIPGGRGARLISGIAWTTAYRVFASLAQLGAMLVLVHIIAPTEYGRAGVVVGILALVNAVSCRAFVSHALQLQEGMRPDWSSHWRAGTLIQLAIFAGCNGLAGLFWLVSNYRPVALLTHVATLGLLLECPSVIRTTMLRRSLDYRRLRMLEGVSKLASILVTLLMGLAGMGAFALVIGANIIPALPIALDLLLVTRWRPDGGWWHWPDWKAYRPAVHFGLQQSWSAMLQSAKGALEAAIFPLRLGYAPLGLFQRAQGLFTSTVGQANVVFQETVYPLLPRESADTERFVRYSTLFVQIVLLITVPGAVFVGSQGTLLSRVLYGQQWIAADPMILPAALVGLSVCAFTAGYGVLLAKNALRACFFLDIATAVLTLPAIFTVALGESAVVYVWTLALGQSAAGLLTIGIASRSMAPNWSRVILVPPVVSAGVAAAPLHLAAMELGFRPIAQLAVSFPIFLVCFTVTLRALFPVALSQVVDQIPGGRRIRRWLWLRPIAASGS